MLSCLMAAAASGFGLDVTADGALRVFIDQPAGQRAVVEINSSFASAGPIFRTFGEVDGRKDGWHVMVGCGWEARL